MAYPRFQRARAFKYVTRTAGNLTISSAAAWADLTTAMDIALNCQVGDVIEYGLNGFWSNEASPAYLDVATIVGGSAVNHFLSGGNTANSGVSAWVAQPVSAYKPFSGSVLYTVVAGDISSGQVTFRLRCLGSGSTRTLRATTDMPLQAFAKNIGPVDPN